ncbi:MAG: PAS domain S-box protein [PVC group bacterium]
MTKRKAPDHRLALVSLAEHLPGVSIQGYHPDGTVFYWNKASEQVYGYPAREALGKNLGELIIPPDLKPFFHQALEIGGDVKESGEFIPPGELLLRRKDGRPVPVYSIHTAVVTGSGEPLLFCIDIDLSEREQLEQSLRQSRDELKKQMAERTAELAGTNARRAQAEEELIKFKTIADEANYGIALADQEGNLVYVNRCFARLHQYTPGELIGKHLSVLHTPEQMLQVDRLNYRLLAAGFFSTEKVWHKKRDGAVFPTLMNATVIKDAAGNPRYLSATAIDISERDRAEKEKRRLEEQLRQAQKMEAVASLAGGMAHDFGNLLNAIRGYVEILKNKLHEKDPLQAEIGELENTVVRAGSLIRKLFAVGRRQSIHPEIIDLNAILTDLEGMLWRVCGRSIELTILPAPGLRTIRADRSQLEQIVINLVFNAREAIPRRGTITVKTDNVELGRSPVPRIIGKQPGPYVVLSVRDTGCGVDKEKRGRLFEPFFSTKDAGNNSGLGLSIIYGIVEQLGGFIQVESDPGRGSTFQIYFPVREEPAGGSTRSRRVLVMDDQEDLRILAGKLLASMGYETECAPDGQLAVEMFRLARQAGRPFDAVLLDLAISNGLNGLEILRRLREIDPGVKSILYSGYQNDPALAGFRDPGFVASFTKPFTREKLESVLDEVLGE